MAGKKENSTGKDSVVKKKSYHGKKTIPQKKKTPPSPERKAPDKNKGTKIKDGSRSDKCCDLYEKCGGCQGQEVPYQVHLKEKQKQVEGLLKNICKVEPILGMDNPYFYRNKVHAVFDRDKKGNIISGVYAEGTHRVIPVEKCLIEDEKADEIMGTIRRLLKSFKVKIYDEDTGYGLLRHVLIRTGFATGQIMVVLVTASTMFPSKNNFVKELLKIHSEITTVVLNINSQRTSMVLGQREQVLYGRGYIEDILCGKIFRISPKSFYQINPVQTEVLYRKAIELAGLTGRETVIDAYCGIGTIGMVASSQAKQVISVELNKDAVRDARVNAKINGINNIEFYNKDAGQFMSNMAAKREKAEVVFMDPPRAGSDERFLNSLAALQPERVVYISCNPVTLQRDLKYLMRKGYEVVMAVPVDMFGWTNHVESVVLLSKLKTDKHIEVELEMDELDLTAAESKATYEEIKEYVLKHTGLKVSSLCIAQVKQKCGIIERENYNKSKDENARQPQCPTEKEVAIREALVHFSMN